MSDVSPATTTPIDSNNNNPSEPMTSETLPLTESFSNSIQTTQTASTESLAIAPESKKSKRWMLPLIVLIAMAALALAGYFYYQNSQLKQDISENTIDSYESCLSSSGSTVKEINPPICITMDGKEFSQELQAAPPSEKSAAGWQTHSAGVFAIKYPEEVILDDFGLTEIRLTKWGPTQQTDTELYDGLSIAISQSDTLVDTLQEFAQHSEKYIIDQQIADIIMPLKEVQIAGNNAYSLTTQGLGTHTYYYLKHPQHKAFIQIVDSTIDPNNSGLIELRDQILSTFEFIYPETSSSLGNWQVYSNREFQFSFKYPSNWFTSISGDGTILFDANVIDGKNIVEPDQVAITVEIITDPKLIAAYEENLPNSQTKEVFNGIEFTSIQPKFTGEGQPPRQVSRMQTTLNNNLVRFGLSDADYQDVFDHILSTFEFEQ